MGFAVQHTSSGQPSRSISPSFQRDISERKNKKDFPTAIKEIALALHSIWVMYRKPKKVPFFRTTICSETQELWFSPCLHQIGPCCLNKVCIFWEITISLYLHNTCPCGIFTLWIRNRSEGNLKQLSSAYIASEHRLSLESISSRFPLSSWVVTTLLYACLHRTWKSPLLNFPTGCPSPKGNKELQLILTR